MAEVINPPPPAVYAFLDSSERTINDGMFVIQPLDPKGTVRQYNDVPSDRHSRGASLSFLDGHVDHHRWRWPKPHSLFDSVKNDQPPRPPLAAGAAAGTVTREGRRAKAEGRIQTTETR